MSSAGRAVSSNGCVTKPKEREIGLTGCAVSIRSSSLTGSYVMETAEHREPYESRGSRTVLGAPGGETPPGDSTSGAAALRDRRDRCFPRNRPRWRRPDDRKLETCKLNDVDPQAWLADVLARLRDHPASRIFEMLPRNWKAARLAIAT